MLPATISDLHRVEGKAELIAGRIVHLGPLGVAPAIAAFKIAISLREHGEKFGGGVAYTSGIAYRLDPPQPNGRQSFSPDASFHAGPLPVNPLDFIDGAPTFAVEVRGETDYGVPADREREAKRSDYFRTGTAVVWDVDVMARAISSYRGDPSTSSAVYRSGGVADAEPAVPGWRLPVDDVFELD